MKFPILFVVQKLQNGDTISNLKAKRVHQVINHYDILQSSVLDDSKVLYVKAVLSLHAVFTMQKALNGFFRLIQISNDGLCIVVSTCSEYIDIIVVSHVRQKLKAIGSDIESELIAFVIVGHVCFLFYVENGVDKSFVQVH